MYDLRTRKLSFQSLEARRLLTFGDVDWDFASDGRFEQSNATENRGEYAQAILDVEGSNQLLIERISGGSGDGVGFRKIDDAGQTISDFGVNGAVNWFDPRFPSTILSEFELSNGNILVELGSRNRRSFAAFDTEGQIVDSFGEAGILRLTPDQRLFHWGSTANPQGGFVLVSQRNLTTYVTKYTNDGALDTGFGTGGVAEFDSVFQPQIRVDAQGRTLVYGERFDSGYKATFVRLNPDGSPDASFGPDGVRSADEGVLLSRKHFDSATETYYIVRHIDSDTERTYTIYRFTLEIEPDDSFGVDGVATLSVPKGLYSGDTRVLPIAGGVIVQDTWVEIGQRSRISMAKLTADGNLDVTFGESGIVQQEFPYEMRQAARLQRDSDGNLFWSGTYEPERNSNWKRDGLLLRFRADGELDHEWSDEGLMKFDRTVPSREIDEVHLLSHRTSVSLAAGWLGYDTRSWGTGSITQLSHEGTVLDSGMLGNEDERWPIAGASNDAGWYSAIRAFNSQDRSHSLEIRRYRSDGTPVSGFGSSGLLSIPTDRMQDVFIRTDRQGGAVIVAGNYEETSDPETQLGVAVIVRLRPDGSLDEEFADGGILRIYEKPETILDVMISLDLGIVLAYRGTILHHLDWKGETVNGFGESGNGFADPIELRPEWVQGKIDEKGGIVGMVRLYVNDGTLAYALVKLDAEGRVVTSFGEGGTKRIEATWDPEFDSPRLSIRSGVIVTANAQADGKTRLSGFDYSGQPLLELGPAGFRDYDFAPHGETVGDLAFADDGSIWIAMLERNGFDRVAAVYHLEEASFGQMHNWSLPFDTNRDEFVTPIDALIVVNYLNGSPTNPVFRPDTNLDNLVTPIDALLVINHLNQSGSGEAESAVLDDTGIDWTIQSWIDLDFLAREKAFKNRGDLLIT